ncbi:MAG: ATP-dependent DNA helicase RecG [Patescibacteria group bacterium]
MLNLNSLLNQVQGIGPATLRKLAILELKTCSDLLWHLPSRYDDFSKVVPIKDIRLGEKVTIRAKLQLTKSRRSWKRHLFITEALVSDGTGSLKCVWFNQPYLAQTLVAGQELFLSGVLQQSAYGLQLEHPTFELVTDYQLHTGRIVPHYPLTAGLTPRLLRQIISKLLPLTRDVTDWLPLMMQKKFSLPNLGQALTWVHFPPSRSRLMDARKRLAFDELFLLRLSAIFSKLKYQKKTAPLIAFSTATKKFVEQLPWVLTSDQRRVAWQIIKDLGTKQPMNRLLQGDVGSGKTVVAGIAALNASLAGWQVVLLAPTEILAEQHFATLTKMFKKWPINLALLTRSRHALYSFSAKNRSKRLVNPLKITKGLANNKINFLIGTHAILAKDIKFSKLGLLIIDEQHRFGVEQRQELTLTSPEITPHLLSLSATPIPRSLALTIYGDLDISLLKEMPQGRQPITTKIIPPSERQQAYQLIRKEISAHNKVFVICPLIEESDVLGVKSATEEKERLSKEVFPDLNLGLLHGKLSGKVKVEVMKNFKNGKTPILVSTSVVEVGVDVPEATVIVIEAAERFGLAQLHQLRGRVGRSERPSHCLLFTDCDSAKSNQRLEALVNYKSGFDLAEQDLSLRGPGDLMGVVQAGWPALKIASLADSALIEQVRQAADQILQNDPTLKQNPLLKQKIQGTNFHSE